MKKRFLVTIYAVMLMFITTQLSAQVSISSDGTPPDNSAMLDVMSTSRGVLAPRMTMLQRNSVANPATGLTVFQTDGIPGLYYNSGTPTLPVWAMVGNNAGQWLNNGNNIYYNLGNVGIGTNAPAAHFHVAENGPNFTGTFGTTINGYTSGTNVAIGNDDNDAVLYVGQSASNKGFLIWQYNSTPSDAYYSVGTYDGLNNLILQEIGGKVGVRTLTPAALFHVAEESPGYTGLFGTPISSWNSSTNLSVGDDNGPAAVYVGQSDNNKGFLIWDQKATSSEATFNIGTFNGSNPLVLQGLSATGARVGVGTSTPEALFHVAKITPGFTGLFGTPISNYSAGTNVSIGDDLNNSLLYIGQNAQNKGFLIWNRNETPSSAYFSVGTYAGNNPLVLQDAGGFVGIGTSLPSSLLEVHYDANSYQFLGYSNAIASYFHHNELEINGDGQTALYAFRTRSTANDGTGYGVYTSNTAMKGYSFWGDLYSFGTAGFSYNDYIRSGGILGATVDGSFWGSLGYKTSGGVGYGGYFSSYNIGAGKSSQAYTGIGIGAWGDLMGADIHGKVYGIYAEGENYALFSNGPVYKNNLDVHLQENGTGTNTVLYTSVSTDVTIQTSGYATLSNGRAFISFDPAFTASVSAETPVVVTVTPTGNSNGVFLSEVSKSGFLVVENNYGKSSVRVSYIAIGKRAGYEHPGQPPEVIDAGYTDKMARGLHNDADTKTNAEGLYYESGRLIVGIHASNLPDPDKPAEETVVPKPSNPRKQDLENKYNRTGTGAPGQGQQQVDVPVKSSTVASPSGGGQRIEPVVKTKPGIDNGEESPARSKNLPR